MLFFAAHYHQLYSLSNKTPLELTKKLEYSTYSKCPDRVREEEEPYVFLMHQGERVSTSIQDKANI